MSIAKENQQEKPSTQQASSASRLKDHLVTYSKVRPHICLICSKGFMTVTALKNHVCIHTEAVPSCRPFISTQPDELKNSGKAITGIDDLHMCEICDWRFSCEVHLKRHLMTHTGEKPHTCGTCGRRFALVANLRTHENIHLRRILQFCEFCKKKFVNSGEYRDHLRNHTSENPSACQLCNETFSNTYKLRAHLLTHRSETDGTNTSSGIETKKQPYSCKICDKKFVRAYYLNRHMEKDHEKDVQ